MLLRLLILVAAVAAPLAGYAQMQLGIGQTPAEFAADSDSALRVAGWAFGIWGVIYAALLAYGVYQALPRTPRSPFLRRMAWPSLIALAGITAWIFAAAWDLELLTIALIVGSAAVLIAPLAAAGPALDGASDRDRRWAAWPLGLLAGWLTIASAANILTVLAGNGQLPGILPTDRWGLVAVAAVALVALWVAGRTRLLAYPLPIAWGLAGVFAAEQVRNSSLSWTAAGAAVVLLAAGAWFAFKRRRSAP